MSRETWMGFVRKDQTPISQEQDNRVINEAGIQILGLELNEDDDVLFVKVNDKSEYFNNMQNKQLKGTYYFNLVDKKHFDETLNSIPAPEDGILDLTSWSGRTPTNPFAKGNMLLSIAIRSKENQISSVNFPEELAHLQGQVRFYGVSNPQAQPRQRQASAGFPTDEELQGPAPPGAIGGQDLMGPGMPPFMGGSDIPTVEPVELPKEETPRPVPRQPSFQSLRKTSSTQLETRSRPTEQREERMPERRKTQSTIVQSRNEDEISLDDEEFPTNSFISHFFQMSNSDLDRSTGYYDENAQFSVTVSGEDSSLSEYHQFTRNLCEEDTNLLIGADAVEGLKMIVSQQSAFKITSVLNSEIMQGFYSVIVSGTVNLKSGKEAYFDRTLTIVDVGESFVIASDQLHISPKPQ